MGGHRLGIGGLRNRKAGTSCSSIRLYDRGFIMNGTPLHGRFDERLVRLSDVAWNVMVMTALDASEIAYIHNDIVAYKIRGNSITNGINAMRREQMMMVPMAIRDAIIPVLGMNDDDLESLNAWVDKFQ